MAVEPTPPRTATVRFVSRVRVLTGEHEGRIGTLSYRDSPAEEALVKLDGDDKFMKFPLSQLEACDAVEAATPPCASDRPTPPADVFKDITNAGGQPSLIAPRRTGLVRHPRREFQPDDAEPKQKPKKQKRRREPAAAPKPEATSTEDAPQMKKQPAQAFFNTKKREAVKAAVAADPETASLAGEDKNKVIVRKLAEMWKALSEAEKQKWKEDAPMVKARGKRKELPPPNAETEKQYEAFKARNPKSKDAKDIRAYQKRDPASFSSFFTIVRRSFSGTAARGGALLRSRETPRRYERETPPPARRDDVRAPF